MQRIRGTVCWFNDTKGFGFIERRGGGKDVFVHYSAIRGPEGTRKTLKEDDEVEFEIFQGKNGPQAGEVEILKHAQSFDDGVDGEGCTREEREVRGYR